MKSESIGVVKINIFELPNNNDEIDFFKFTNSNEIIMLFYIMRYHFLYLDLEVHLILTSNTKNLKNFLMHNYNKLKNNVS